MKKNLIIISILMLLLSSVTSFADHVTNYSDPLDTDFDIIQNLEEDIISRAESFINANSQGSKLRSETSLDTLDYESVFKVYEFDAEMDQANLSGQISDILPEKKYCLKYPIAINEGFVYATTAVENGKEIGTNLTETYDTSLSNATYLFDDTLIQKGIDTIATDLDELSYQTVSRHRLDFVYMVSGDQRYAVPFAARADFIGLENGKLYKYEEFSTILNDYLAEIESQQFSDSSEEIYTGYGGGGNIEATNVNNINLVAAAFFALLVFAFVYKCKGLKKEK